MGFPKLGTNFSNYLNLAVEFGFYFLQEKIIVSDRLGHLSLELHMLGGSQAVSLDSRHSPHFPQPRIEVLQLRWWILKLLLWMDLVLAQRPQLLIIKNFTYNHRKTLDMRPDHEVHHGRLVASKERSSLPLQLGVHLRQLGDDGAPVRLKLLAGELGSHSPPAPSKFVE